MTSEREWASDVVKRLEASLDKLCPGGPDVGVVDQRRLIYAHEVHRYRGDQPLAHSPRRYATDLLVFDRHDADHWTPRVVVEMKLGQVTTHDALTYSTKASTHKQVHPYLRYGILIGAWGSSALPRRLVRHGAHFDFMATWTEENPSDEEWNNLLGVLRDEVAASRNLQALLQMNRSPLPNRYTILHRPLQLK